MKGYVLEVSILRLPHSAARWDLVRKYQELRRQVFILEKNWDLQQAEDREFEQYDGLLTAHYVIAHKEGKVIAGARLLRCDNRVGSVRYGYTYMIRDAWLGRIDLPREMCWKEPQTGKESWELTRLVSIDPDPNTARAVLDAANAYLRKLGAKNCLILGHPALMRLAKRYGYAPVPLGPVVGNQDGRFLAFQVAVI